jgi:hypothetical protein
VCWARRFLVRAFACRFFGTAMRSRHGSRERLRARLLVQLQPFQLRHARVAAALVAVSLGIGVVERLAADRAEAGAIGTAERLRRQGEDDGVVGPAFEVEASLVHVWAIQFLIAGGRLIYLPDVDLQGKARLLQAAHAGAREPGMKAQAQCVTGAGPRDVETRRRGAALGLVGLSSERHRLKPQVQVEAPSLAVGESQLPEVDDAGFHERSPSSESGGNTIGGPRSARLRLDLRG